MGPLSFSAVLKGAIIAGIVAALVVAAFHFIFTEPLIDRAVQIEEQNESPAMQHEPPMVSRNVQKAGLVLGYLLFSLSWGLPFAVAYHLLQQRLSIYGAWKGAFLLAFLAYWALVLLPFLKYPANPPGVGEPDTIGYRQSLYVSFLLLGLASTALSIPLGTYLARRFKIGRRWLITLGCMVLFAGVLFLSMPGNPDPVRLPPDLMLRFRLFSLAGLTLFWLSFGVCFGWRMHKAANRHMSASLVSHGTAVP